MGHCSECGYEGSSERVPQRGSDVVPLFRCPECDHVEAISCRCGSSEAHQGGEA